MNILSKAAWAVAPLALTAALWADGSDSTAPAGMLPPQPISVGLDPAHARPFPAVFFGSNAGALRNSFNWDDPGFQRALKKLTIVRNLRFPAGEIANYWDWKTGSLLFGYAERFSETHNAYPAPLSELASEISVTGAEPLFVLNMLTDPTTQSRSLSPSSPNLDYQLQMLAAARAMGIHLNYLELGNEFYLKGKPDYLKVYPNPATKEDPPGSVVYARLATLWIKAIKDRYPQVKIAVVGGNVSFVHMGEHDRQGSWLHGLLDPSFNSPEVGGDGKAALQGADAITLHAYVPPDMPRTPTGARVDGRMAQDLIAGAFKVWNIVKEDDLPLIPRNMGVWFTEFNMGNQVKAAAHGTWAHGVYMTALSLLFLEDSRVQITDRHELVGDAGHADLFYSDRAFAPGHHARWVSPPDPPATTPWGMSATADALNLVGEASAGAPTAEELSFPNVPMIENSRGTVSYPALYGWSFVRGSVRQSVVLNLCDRPLTIDPSKIASGGSYDQLTGDPGTYVTGGLKGSPSNLAETHGAVDPSAPLALPPFSVTLLRPM